MFLKDVAKYGGGELYSSGLCFVKALEGHFNSKMCNIVSSIDHLNPIVLLVEECQEGKDALHVIKAAHGIIEVLLYLYCER